MTGRPRPPPKLSSATPAISSYTMTANNHQDGATQGRFAASNGGLRPSSPSTLQSFPFQPGSLAGDLADTFGNLTLENSGCTDDPTIMTEYLGNLKHATKASASSNTAHSSTRQFPYSPSVAGSISNSEPTTQDCSTPPTLKTGRVLPRPGNEKTSFIYCRDGIALSPTDDDLPYKQLSSTDKPCNSALHRSPPHSLHTEGDQTCESTRTPPTSPQQRNTNTKQDFGLSCNDSLQPPTTITDGVEEKSKDRPSSPLTEQETPPPPSARASLNQMWSQGGFPFHAYVL
ncbi:hypothetical protein EDB81DRAFT_312311 [Dactylonectria macrodidyma]|uniref:Uncharacterized protein n=1 Tax=Dactylonectria macrodidyma TaxID=307937 RepID=A0A9P9IAB5_9HYPO|nr:hypothetical protein EDB81DRAFT_312311 [Dactylonectria macrodidyma]